VLRNEAEMRLNDYDESIKKWIDVAKTTNSRKRSIKREELTTEPLLIIDECPD
jgi:hypothetical protein